MTSAHWQTKAWDLLTYDPICKSASWISLQVISPKHEIWIVTLISDLVLTHIYIYETSGANILKHSLCSKHSFRTESTFLIFQQLLDNNKMQFKLRVLLIFTGASIFLIGKSANANETVVILTSINGKLEKLTKMFHGKSPKILLTLKNIWFRVSGRVQAIKY